MTIRDFHTQYPDDDTCLRAIFIFRYQDEPCACGRNTWYKLKKRKTYSCSCGTQRNPLSGTIFHNSPIPLKDWFYVLYLLSVSKNGISAKEIQRHIGVTYKTAWRMGHKLRVLFAQSKDKLNGTVEVDEAFIGGRIRGESNKNWRRNKSVLMGMVQRGGKVKILPLEGTETHMILEGVKGNIEQGSRVISDEYSAYKKLGPHYAHDSINHSKGKYVVGDITTNRVENLWSHIKKSLHGTYSYVSKKYLMSYVDHLVWQRNQGVFSDVVSKAGRRFSKALPLEVS